MTRGKVIYCGLKLRGNRELRYHAENGAVQES
jgi:hypothetical protein